MEPWVGVDVWRSRCRHEAHNMRTHKDEPARRASFKESPYDCKWKKHLDATAAAKSAAGKEASSLSSSITVKESHTSAQ